MTSHIMPVYPRHDVRFVRGKGSYLFDADDRAYLDCLSGIAVNALGHCPDVLVEALQKQSEKLWHISNFFHIPGQEELADKIIEHSFADTVFFVNSGVEAWECCIKTMLKYHYENGNPERWRIITLEGCFHGRTLAAIAASKAPKMVKGFGRPVEGFDQVPFGDMEALEAAITPETAGVCIEPLQGEGGIRPHTAEQLREIRAICDRHGVLLMYDEIQCGAGRTGDLWAYEASGAAPDVMSIAKGIGGGFPLGACLSTAEAAKGMTVGVHGTTFGGNPLAMAVGLKVMDALTAPSFLERATERGAYFYMRLQEVMVKHTDIVVGMRGRGLMLGLQFEPQIDTADIITKLLNAGLITGIARDNIIRFVPPLNISEAEIDEAIAILETVLEKEKVAS